jgi:hypothetical protein
MGRARVAAVAKIVVPGAREWIVLKSLLPEDAGDGTDPNDESPEVTSDFNPARETLK